MGKDEEENTSLAKAGGAMAVELAKDIYQDALRPTLEPLGTTTGRVVKAALSPVRGLVWTFEKIEEWVVARVTRLLGENPEVVAPDPRVAAPILLQLSYSMDEPTVREMYARLLATAMDSARAHLAHPSYVRIVEQLNRDEALILQYVNSHSEAIVVAKASGERHVGPSLRVVSEEFCNLPEAVQELARPDLWRFYLDNLQRLNLLEVDYDADEREPFYQTALAWLGPKLDEFRVGTTGTSSPRGFLKLTEYGRTLTSIVIGNDPLPTAPMVREE